MGQVYCGIDWAENHHDVALVDAEGKLVAKRRIADSAAGFADLTAMLADGRRQRGRADPGRDRDLARAAGRRVTCHRSAGLSDQPDGGGPLPGAALGLPEEVRPRRRDDVGEHLAHRRAYAPTAAGRHRARPRHRGAGPRPPGRDVATWLEPATSCVRCCASTTQGSWPPSPAAVPPTWPPPMLVLCWRLPRPRRPPPS